ncbi:BLUF domain-containing protein [Lacinutrix neustonica]|uniref:BLUF domain-containing protein n=1 Tax=Lacinutrix neustonica TaxID=2980107 RepID=A0A9E8SCW6_9FLAO|nr:BLUF domain-containing protein [Lacinutrix neustonica]WAC01446.1 BLUF domain-containing protein [Lacinutrix neustonica]
MYKTVCYLSTPSRNLSILDYEALFYTIKNNNDRLKIYGALIKTQDVFFQIIEGEVPIIDALLEKIKTDSRHKNIIEMLNQPIDKPTFSDFGVGYSIINHDATIRAFYKYINSLESNKTPSHSLFCNIISKLINVDV